MDTNQLNKELTGFAFYHLDGEDRKLTCTELKCKLFLNRGGTFGNFVNSFNPLLRFFFFNSKQLSQEVNKIPQYMLSWPFQGTY